jgi:hypothetical protein
MNYQGEMKIINKSNYKFLYFFLLGLPEKALMSQNKTVLINYSCLP